MIKLIKKKPEEIFVPYQKAKFPTNAKIKEFNISSYSYDLSYMNDGFDFSVFLEDVFGIKRKVDNNSLEWKLRDALYRILQIETPILLNDCFERLTQEFINVYSKKHLYYLNQIVINEIDKGLIIERNNFLYLKDTKILVRDRYYAFSKVELEKISKDELEVAAHHIIKNQYGIEQKELIKIISKSIGIKRMTQNIFNKILTKLDCIKDDKKIIIKDDKYFYND